MSAKSFLPRLPVALLAVLCLVPAVRMNANTYTFQPSDSDLGDLAHSSAYIWGITVSQELMDQLNNGYVITSAYITIKNLNNWDVRDTNNHLFFDLLDNPKSGITTITDDPTDNGVNQGVISDYFAGKTSGNSTTTTVTTRGSPGHPSTTTTTTSYVGYGVASDGTTLTGVANSGAVTPIVYQNGQNWYQDTDSAAHTITINFDASILSILADYITDAHVGTGAADFGIGFDPDCHFYNDGICLTIVTECPPPPSVPDGGVTLMLVGAGFLATVGIVRFRRRA